MGAVRNLGLKLLQAVLRHAPESSREWAEAMLRELDFIEGDWEALFWAFGSVAAILRHSAADLGSWFWKRLGHKEEKMNEMGKKTVGVVSGALIAAALVVLAFSLLFGAGVAFPSLGIEHAEWTHILTIVVVPEVIFVTAAILLWRKRRPTAAGILITGIVLAAHVIVHFAGR